MFISMCRTFSIGMTFFLLLPIPATPCRTICKTAVPFTMFFAQMKKWRSLSGSVIRKTLRPPPTFKKFLPCGGTKNTVTTELGNFTPTLTYRSRTRPACIAESLINHGHPYTSNQLPPSTAPHNASVSVFIPFPVGGHLEARKVVHRCLKTQNRGYFRKEIFCVPV